MQWSNQRWLLLKTFVPWYGTKLRCAVMQWPSSRAVVATLDGAVGDNSPRSPLSPGIMIDGDRHHAGAPAATPIPHVPREKKDRSSRPPSLVAFSASQKTGKETLERFLSAVH